MSQFNTEIPVEEELAPTKGRFPHPKNRFYAGASFSGSLIRDALQCEAAQDMRDNLVWTDVFWNHDANTWKQWKFTTAVANTLSWDKHRVKERYAEIEEEVAEYLYDVASGNAVMLGCEPPTLEEMKEEEMPLYELAEYAVMWKFQWTTFYHGKVEETTVFEIADRFGVEEFAPTTPEMEELGVHNPEPRGIDVYFPNLNGGTAVQVKTGPGGMVEDCDADVLARYLESGDTPAGEGAKITLEPIPDDA